MTEDIPPQVARQKAIDMLHFRVLVCIVVISILFCLLALRLWQVQVLQGSDHLARAQRQMIRPVRVNAVRGRIFARDGTVLVDNEAHYDLVFYVSEMRQPGVQRHTIEHIVATEQRLAQHLGRVPRLTAETVKRQLQRQPVLPLTVMEDLSEDELARYAEYLPLLPGVDILCRVERRHPFPGVLSHVLGYAGWKRPTGDDILEDLPRLYTSPELTGRSGLEARFDQTLAGSPGARLVMVDSIGYARSTIEESTTPVDGNDLHLTIDLPAQKIAEELLKGYSGAIVVLDVRTGAVLAMASSPTYSLDHLNASYMQLLAEDTEHRPLLNRATQGLYTPGSIVKPLLAAVALEKCPELALQRYDCSGRFMIGNHPIRCARRFGHGMLDLTDAITVSCNPFFIHLGLAVGIDEYSQFLRAAGIGERTGIELRDAAGVLPARDYARRRWKRNWLAVDTAYASIGQGAFSITPLQAAVYTAAIANGGAVYRPYLVAKICTQDGRLLQQTAPVIRHRLPVSQEHLAMVQRAMQNAVEDPHEASAAGLREAGIPLAAKTGTAEVGEGEERYKNTWVIAFGPVDEPQYAIACIIDHGQSGGRTAVPIAAQFFHNWLCAQ